MALTVAAIPAYIGIMFYAWHWTTELSAHLGVPAGRPIPTSGAPEPWRIASETLIALRAGITEEIQLLAIPIAMLLALRHRIGVWFPIATLLLVEILRIGIHLHYGCGALYVAPWMAGTLLLYRAVRLVWPFIIGHAIYDALAFSGNMGLHTPHQALLDLAQVGLPLAAGLLLTDAIRRMRASETHLRTVTSA
jgi:hypothetical protein